MSEDPGRRWVRRVLRRRASSAPVRVERDASAAAVPARDAVAHHERLRRNLDRLVRAASVARDRSGAPRAAIAIWDLTHNPIGRAVVLHRLLEHEWEVDVVGPMWQSHGTSLWEPAVGELGRVRWFPATSVADYLTRAVAMATAQRYDLVVAAKYRLPGLHLATLLAEWSDAPLIVDIDDLESTLAGEFDEAPAATMDDLFDGPAARLEERSVEVADAVTVVSPPLQERFGGTIVRHSRPLATPSGSPAGRARRIASRSRFGIGEDEIAVLFIGTVRPHKGVQDVVAAIHELARDDVRLHLFTTTPRSVVDALVAERIGSASDRYVHHGHCRLSDVPAILAGADAVVLAQDPDSPITAYQVPAKISDATAVGCRVLAPDLDAYRDLADLGLVESYAPGELVSALAALIDEPDDAARAASLQQRFRRELSHTVNAARLATAVDRATTARASRDPSASAVLHDEIIDLYERHRPFLPPDLERGPHPDLPVYDVAFFWKQNDSDLYGRRSDMVVRQAFRLGRVRNGVHFDAPVDARSLAERLPPTPRSLPRQGDFELAAIVERHLRLRDDRVLPRRCFLHSGVPASGTRLFGHSVPDPAAYADFVLAELEAAGLEPHRTVGWLWPVVPDLDRVLARVGFGAVVCDLVDDQRTWPHLDDEARRSIEEGYRIALEAADLVLCNSPANAEAFARYGKEVVIVPNGADSGLRGPPRAGARPCIGYVGDMQDRIDWSLVEVVAESRPEWDLVLVGEVPARSPGWGLATRHANVSFTGVVPYEAARELMRSFDVGIVPHLVNEQSLRMDPLKVYNYLAMGVPVVSTAHPTALGFGERVAVATSPAEFVELVEAGLAAVPDEAPSVEGFSWAERVSTIFALLDEAAAARRCRVLP